MPYGNINYQKRFYYTKRFTYKDFVLDSYKNNIKLGFSYYKLLLDYIGYCIRVRRSSDNLEQDFGFFNGYIDIASILAFCGAGSGYVTIWYNQYSLGNNAVQEVTGNQPIIVDAGVFESNGLKFVSSDPRYLAFDNYAAINFTTVPVSIYANYVSANTATRSIFHKNTTVTVQFGLIIISNLANFRINTTTGVNAIQHSATDTNIITKSLYMWRDKDADGLIGNQNNVILTATQNVDITSGILVTIGARNTGTVGAPLMGNVKSFVMADTVIDYSIISKV